MRGVLYLTRVKLDSGSVKANEVCLPTGSAGDQLTEQRVRGRCLSNGDHGLSTSPQSLTDLLNDVPHDDGAVV
jgi:hypothetical protein